MLAFVEGHRNRASDDAADGLVGEYGVDVLRTVRIVLSLPLSLEGSNSAHRLNDVVKGRPSGVWARFRKSIRAAIDQSRIAFAQTLVIEAEFTHRLRPHGCYEDIRAVDQVEQYISLVFALQIERDAAFVAVQVEKRSAHSAVAERREVARNIAFRRFDLDYIGAHVAQNLGRIRPHHNRGQIDDANACQRARHNLILSIMLM